MFKKLLFFLLICTQVHGVYFKKEDPNSYGKVHLTNEHLPFMCQIDIKNKLFGITTEEKTGTGIFVAPNIVLTTYHLFKEGMNNTTVKVHTKPDSFNEYQVKKQLFYQEGDPITLTLLILEENATNIQPADIKPLDLTSLPQTISFAGYGKGECMDPNKCHKRDIEEFYQNIGYNKDIVTLRDATVNINDKEEEFFSEPDLIKRMIKHTDKNIHFLELCSATLSLDVYSVVLSQENALKNKQDIFVLNAVKRNLEILKCLDKEKREKKALEHRLNSPHPIVALRSHSTTCSFGDSGGPLMDEKRKVIGLIEGGTGFPYYSTVAPNTEEITKQVKAIINAVVEAQTQKYYFFQRPFIHPSIEMGKKTFAHIFSIHRQKLWAEVFAHDPKEPFVTKFQALTKDQVSWINKAIEEHSK